MILSHAKIIGNLYLELVAELSEGAQLNDDGSLPKDSYGTYYRVALDTGNTGYQYLIDPTAETSIDVFALLDILGDANKSIDA